MFPLWRVDCLAPTPAAPAKRARPDLPICGGEDRLGPMGRRRLKLIFGPDMVKEPVIYQMGKQFEIITNIRRADVTRDQGWVLLEITGEPDELDRGVEYLESRGVKVEPAEGDLVE